MAITQNELNEIISEVEKSLKESSRTIEQLPLAQSVSGGTLVEINNGRSATMDVLKRYIAPQGKLEGEV